MSGNLSGSHRGTVATRFAPFPSDVIVINFPLPIILFLMLASVGIAVSAVSVVSAALDAVFQIVR